MRNLIILLVVILCSTCAHVPAEIPDALPNQAQAVVFDIDGTLTPRPSEFLEVRPDAAKAVHTFADKGYKIIYLSARYPLFEGGTVSWLKKHGFPDGFVRVGETAADVQNPAQFKTRILQDFLAHGWKVEFAYGDSSTDFDAYAAVKIPQKHVFALRREEETLCQSGIWEKCLSGWTEHMDFITKTVQSAAAK